MSEHTASIGERRARLPLPASQEETGVPPDPRIAPNDAGRLTRLADTATEERIVVASLDAMQSAYGSRGSKKPLPDAEVDRVLLKHIGSRSSAVAAAAFRAARIPLMTERPSDELTQGIVEQAAPDKPAARRHAALEALDLIRPDRRSAPVLRAFEQALGTSEPHLLSLALRALSQSGASLAAFSENERAGLAARVLELAEHFDPGVAGRALEVLAELEFLFPSEVRSTKAREGLRHVHAYVIARAADLTARCGRPSAIHALMAHTSDLRPARYELAGWTALEGGPGNLVHVVPGRPRVADAALYAIVTLSQGLTGIAPLSLTLGGPRRGDADVRENSARARSWYASARPGIPQD
ncbi:MAG TPA: hypothetical protein VIM73_11475 [Polyangiaceae bacterium]